MHPIKVLIVEDQLIVADDIAIKLKNHSLEVAAICGSGEEAINLVESLEPDLILMDIRLSGKLDGITTAEIIQSKRDIPIIYLSDHTDEYTVTRAKKTTPASFLSKAIPDPDLVRNIDLAFSNANTRRKSRSFLLQGHIFVRTESQVFVKIPLNDILYLEADRAYCDIVCAGKKYTLSNSMNHVIDQIDSPDFRKIHRSFIININKIEAIDGNMVKIGGRELQMSKEYRDELMGRLKFVR